MVIGLLSCALLGRELSWTHKRLQRLNTVSIGLALVWYPLGILLSGNKELNFSGDADGFMFGAATIGIISWCLFFLLMSLGMRLKAFVKRKFFRTPLRNSD